MINDILAFWTPGPNELIVILVVGLIVFGIPVLLIVLFVRYFLRNKRENIRLRMELGKLADELEQVRKQAEQNEKHKSPAQSG